MEVLGIDIGFGFTKASNGKEFIMFKSIFGEAVDIQFYADLGNNSNSDQLHVTIDDKSYFVGDYAEQQSNVRQFTLDQEKLITDFVKILALTVAGKFSNTEAPINIVSGLPVSYFKEHNTRFAKLLTGQHTITYHKTDGKSTTKRIFIKKVRMMPQPLGSFFNLLMDDKGKITNMELTKQKVGIIDIGFRTTDFSIFDKLRYIDRGSTTMDTGISKIFRVIANRLHEKSGINVELYRLYNAVESGLIKMRGQEYDISKIRDQVFMQSAETIANDIDRMWAEDWDIDSIILTGGGCNELAKYLQPMISGHVLPVEKNKDARLNNVRGYLKYGKYIWGESGLCVTPPEIAEQAKAS
ncbi:MAG: ParM/StbA family protein [Desulfobacteraceae bacterium]|nr:MAG: ParM/StbA family protein [Desulfobacteraceae bacterium]